MSGQSWTVTFVEPWGPRSWKVSHNLSQGLYRNDRRPHVEVGESNMRNQIYSAGKTYSLINPHIINRKAIAFDVEGVLNGTKQAHFTVYFGTDARQYLKEYQS